MCSDRSMEVNLPAPLENYDKNYERQTTRPVIPQTDRPGQREVSLPIRKSNQIKKNQVKYALKKTYVFVAFYQFVAVAIFE